MGTVDCRYVSSRAEDNLPDVVEQDAEAGIRDLDDLAVQACCVRRVVVDDVEVEVDGVAVGISGAPVELTPRLVDDVHDGVSVLVEHHLAVDSDRA